MRCCWHLSHHVTAVHPFARESRPNVLCAIAPKAAHCRLSCQAMRRPRRWIGDQAAAPPTCLGQVSPWALGQCRQSVNQMFAAIHCILCSNSISVILPAVTMAQRGHTSCLSCRQDLKYHVDTISLPQRTSPIDNRSIPVFMIRRQYKLSVTSTRGGSSCMPSQF